MTRIFDRIQSFCLSPEQVKTDDLKNVLNTQMYSPQDGNAHLGRFTVDPKYTDFIGEIRRSILISVRI